LKITIFAQHYYPEEISGAVLATELAEFLAEKGHQVTFITCAPSYPKGEVFAGYQNRLIQKEKRNGVDIIRVWSFISPKKGFWSRIFNYATFSLFAFLGGLAAQNPDVIFSYSPPLPLGLAAWLLAKIKRVPWVFRVEDLYPDAAVAAGVIRNPLAIRFFYALEKFLYNQANHISLISEGFRKIVVNKGIPVSKISVTPVWADPESIIDHGKNTAFRKEHGLQDSFLVLYAGNLGQTSGLEEVIDAAELLDAHPEIQFVFVGEGIKKEALIRRVKEKNLQNVRFLPYQPRAVFSDMMTSADLHIVTINSESSKFSLPCKTFTSMASSRPILAVSPRGSELAQLIQQYDCGVNVEPGNPKFLAEKIGALSRQKNVLNEMGRHGRAALVNGFAKKNCLLQIHKVLVDVGS